jgi:xanthine dehydrogenase accessory factor
MENTECIKPKDLKELTIAIKGAGDIASGIAWSLFQAHICNLFMLEVPEPLAVRRTVCFCEALIDGQTEVEGVEAVKAEKPEEIQQAWHQGKIPVLADPGWSTIEQIKPDVVVDATMAKCNLGTRLRDAPLVIGLAPGFVAGGDVHMVIETNRGHNLGRIISSGAAEPDTGVPGDVAGYKDERVLRAPAEGTFYATGHIGDLVKCGDLIGHTDEHEIRATIDGKIRGLIRSGIHVTKELKIGDIDPRGAAVSCETISDKSLAVARAVLEAILRVYNG